MHLHCRVQYVVYGVYLSIHMSPKFRWTWMQDMRRREVKEMR